MHFLIIGGGIAGTTAAEELRKLDSNADITLVSEEEHPVYSRVLLPHYVKEKIPRERVFLKKEMWYAEKNIEWMTGVICEHLDVRNKFVALSNGREVEYDTLLIATGGEVRTVPFDFAQKINECQISYFRTLADTDHLVSLLSGRNSSTQGHVIGGGFIACEYINIFAHFKIPTTVTLRSDRFWSRVFDEETGRLINEKLKAGGVKVRRFGGSESLNFSEPQNIRTSEPPILGIGIGIAPDFTWLRDSGIKTNIGILANEYLETNIPDVYTAGDISEFQDIIVNRQVNIGNWMNAQMQGRHVAKILLGEREPFKLVSSYATNILGLEIIFVGDTDRSCADEIVVRGSVSEGGVTQLFIRNQKVVGATIVGRNSDRQPITQGIRNQVDKTAIFS